MKTILNLSILMILLCFSTAYAITDDFDYPNSNGYIYPEYEVNLITTFSGQLQKAIYNTNFNDDTLVEFISNFEYDIASHKDKVYSSFIIISLAKAIENNTFDLANNEKAKTFITNNENSDNYNDCYIWKKFLTWVFLRKSASKNIVIYFKERRIKLLESIIKKNPKYAGLASFIIVCVEYPKLHSQVELVKKDINSLNEFIKTYPDSEFAAKASTFILNKYISIKDYDSAINHCHNILNKYKNFYTGVSDLYFDIYTQMLQMCKDTNNQAKIIYFISKLNKKSNGYKDVTEYFLKK